MEQGSRIKDTFQYQQIKSMLVKNGFKYMKDKEMICTECKQDQQYLDELCVDCFENKHELYGSDKCMSEDCRYPIYEHCYCEVCYKKKLCDICSKHTTQEFEIICLQCELLIFQEISGDNTQFIDLDQDIFPGQLIKGVKDQYIVQKVIGQGTTGKVYKCQIYKENQSQDQKAYVAMKVGVKQSGDWQYNQMVYEGYKREQFIQKQIFSENIVQIIENFEQKNKVFTIMEYCNGSDLLTLMEYEGQNQTFQPISEHVATDYIYQIIKGYMAYQDLFMNQQVAHRDLKPANLLVNDGKIKIADFGCAKVISQEQMLKSYVGSKLWMAPEIMKCQPYTNKCDIFSLGVIFYQLLYGKNPFEGASEHKLVESIDQQNIYFTKDIADPRINDLIEVMLSFNEWERISWKELINHSIFKNREQNIKKMETYIQKNKSFFIGFSKGLQKELIQKLCINVNLDQILKNEKSFKNYIQDNFIVDDFYDRLYFITQQFDSLSLIDVQQLGHDTINKNIKQMTKICKSQKQRNYKDLMNDINNTFYHGESIYAFSNSQLKKQCKNYLEQYYEVMEEYFCQQFKDFKKQDIKKFKDQFLNLQQAQELIVKEQMYELKDCGLSSQNSSENRSNLSKRTNSINNGSYYNPYMDCNNSNLQSQNNSLSRNNTSSTYRNDSLQKGEMVMKNNQLFEIIDVNNQQDDQFAMETNILKSKLQVNSNTRKVSNGNNRNSYDNQNQQEQEQVIYELEDADPEYIDGFTLKPDDSDIKETVNFKSSQQQQQHV